MTWRRAIAVFAAAMALLLAIDLLVYNQYRREVAAVEATLDDRLLALGQTAARWLGDRDAPDAPGALAALVDANRLEDAYLVDHARAVTAGVRTAPGPLNLLRADGDRLADAFAGSASVGDGYSIENARVEAAYFPVRGGAIVLALEAGAEYHAPADQLRATLVVSIALTAIVALVFGAGLVLALRAIDRARVAYGRAERLAAVGQMAAMVAHEVRNPLGILRGQVELARERLGDGVPARERERFAEMLAEVDRLGALTEDFLGLARDTPLDRAPVDLGALAAAVADDVRVVAPDAHVTAAVPERELVVRADADRLRQAIRNLALNAVQIGGAGVSVRVEVAPASGGRARVAVVDDGPGVPPELAATLFEPFVSARAGGSGLGLAIARRIAEGHGGTLVLESPPGHAGATFAIYLPV